MFHQLVIHVILSRVQFAHCVGLYNTDDFTTSNFSLLNGIIKLELHKFLHSCVHSEFEIHYKMTSNADSQVPMHCRYSYPGTDWLVYLTKCERTIKKSDARG